MTNVHHFKSLIRLVIKKAMATKRSFGFAVVVDDIGALIT